MIRQRTPILVALLLALALSPALLADTGLILTVAGTGTSGNTAAGGLAVNTSLNTPSGIAVDSSGNLFIADRNNNRVVRVDASSGIASQVAGNGTAASSGDGGLATQASINFPLGVVLDSAGNVYISEALGNRVRQVNAQTGIITTYAGTGTAGYSGDGGQATAASLKMPYGIAFDSAGNLYIADVGNECIRSVNVQTGIITTVAGNGTNALSPDGVPAAGASLSMPMWVAFDLSGGLLISETGGSRLRRVDPQTGLLSTVAGNGSASFTGDGVAATSAGIAMPSGLAVDPNGNIFFSDGTARVRRVDSATGVISTVAGNGSGLQGSCLSGGGGASTCSGISLIGDNGPATNATLDGPVAVALAPNGNLLVSDWIDCVVRRVYLPSPLSYTGTTLTASATSLGSGQGVLLTATVTPIGVGGVPTGGIEFADAPVGISGTVLGTAPLNGGTASLVPGTLSQGGHRIVAYYGGDASFNGSGSPSIPISVSGAAMPAPTVTLSATTLPDNPNPTYPPTATFAAVVAPPSGHTTVPSGPAVLYDGSTLVASANLVNGAATFSVTFTVPGLYSLSAKYLGDSNYSEASSSTLPLWIGDQVSISLTPAGPLTYGQPVTISASVWPSTATGTVTFEEYVSGGTIILGTATLSGGQASLTEPSLGAGSQTIVAIYSGDSVNQEAFAYLPIQVAKAAANVTLTSSINPCTVAQYPTLTAAVTPAGLIGSVQFLDGTTLLGTATLTNGTATFYPVPFTVGTHSLTAVYGGDMDSTAGTSPVVTQVVTKVVSSIALSSKTNPSTYGQSIWLTAAVSPSSATGTVQVLDGATSLGTATVSNGWAYVQPLVLTAGAHSITAVYSGDANTTGITSAVLVQNVSQAISYVSVSSPASSQAYGQPVTFTAWLAELGSNGPWLGTGTVQFLDGATPLGTVTPANGSAVLTVPSLAAGTHSISAVYSGDANVAGSTSAVYFQNIYQASSSVTLASSANPSAFGQPVAFTAAVTPAAATGTVQFLDGAASLGTATLSGGSASLTVSSLAAGAHSITAAYGGSANYTAGSSAPVAQTVNKAASSVTVASSANPSTYGQSLLLTASVSPATATGTVQFLDGTTSLGSATITGGTAAFAPSGLTAGAHSITAVYSGDANFLNGVSPAVTQTVNQMVSSVALTTSPNPSTYPTAVNLSAAVSPASATGTVQFMLDGALLVTGTLNASGISTAGVLVNPGTHTVIAVYSGDANDTSATSPAVTQVVNKAASSVALTSSPNPSSAGGAVTFTAVVTPAAATGTVQFLDAGIGIGTGTLAGGSASLTISTLPAGAHSITAVYSGDGNTLTSTSAALSQTINKVASSVTLASSANPSTVGQPVNLAATVTPASATGTVQFLDGATSLGSVAVSGGSATLPTSALAAGTHSITAVYSGDANDTASASSAVAQTVNKAPSGVTLASSLNPSAFGQSVTFTAAITPAAATGTVQFLDGATSLGTATIAGGSATLPASALAAGAHSITAVYSGDTNYLTSNSAALAQTVNKAPSGVTLASSLNPSSYGQSVTFTAAITPAAATGTVQFLDGATSLGTANLASGAASLAISTLAVGTHSITAVYSGSANDAAGTSSAVSQTVNKAASSVALTSSVNPSAAGQSVTFTATVSPSAATGTVQFLDGKTSLGTANLASGSASLAISTLASATHSITAVYSGDANYLTGTSAAVNQIVLPGAPTKLTAAAASSTQINLAWTASPTSGVTYNVYSSTSSGFTPSAANRVATGLTAVSYSNTGLSPSTTHYYLVTAQNSAGESAASNQASATTAVGIACHVTYGVTSQWNTGFGGALTIENTGSTTISNWNLTWTWPGNQQITQSWDASYTQKGANATLTYESYNATIAPGATISGIGFNASYSGTNTAPSAFYVNGTLCK
jgi:hypothetical protein